jgi:hypothetical protein
MTRTSPAWSPDGLAVAIVDPSVLVFAVIATNVDGETDLLDPATFPVAWTVRDAADVLTIAGPPSPPAPAALKPKVEP